MDGIMLDGNDPQDLLVKLRHNLDRNAKNELRQAQGVAKKYSDYEALASSPNGNCFFNAFSLLLYGNESLATRLRLAMCLGVMDTSDKGLSGFNAIGGGVMPTIDVDEINRKLPGMSSAGTYKGWAEIQDIAYVSQLIKRPIKVLYHKDPDTDPDVSK